MDLKPPQQLLRDMLDRADTIATLHGGNWTFQNGEPWEPRATAGYRGTSCATDPESLQYKQVLLGPAVDDPKAAVENIEDYFAERGFEVSNRFKSEFKGDQYIVFSMINDEGASFVYKPGTNSTGLTVESGCSTDPAMNQVTE